MGWSRGASSTPLSRNCVSRRWTVIPGVVPVRRAAAQNRLNSVGPPGPGCRSDQQRELPAAPTQHHQLQQRQATPAELVKGTDERSSICPSPQGAGRPTPGASQLRAVGSVPPNDTGRAVGARRHDEQGRHRRAWSRCCVPPTSTSRHQDDLRRVLSRLYGGGEPVDAAVTLAAARAPGTCNAWARAYLHTLTAKGPHRRQRRLLRRDRAGEGPFCAAWSRPAARIAQAGGYAARGDVEAIVSQAQAEVSTSSTTGPPTTTSPSARSCMVPLRAQSISRRGGPAGVPTGYTT